MRPSEAFRNARRAAAKRRGLARRPARRPTSSSVFAFSALVAVTGIFKRSHSGATIVRLMPRGTAVHARTSTLCESLNYRDWSGYYAVSSYESHHEHEYV